MQPLNLVLGIAVALVGCGAGALIAIGDMTDAKALISGFVGTVLGHTVGNIATKPSEGGTK